MHIDIGEAIAAGVSDYWAGVVPANWQERLRLEDPYVVAWDLVARADNGALAYQDLTDDELEELGVFD